MSKSSDSIVSYSKQTVSSVVQDALLTNNCTFISRLKGKILTLADSSFSDPEQRKAFKDLASQMLDIFRDTEMNPVAKDLVLTLSFVVGDVDGRTSQSPSNLSEHYLNFVPQPEDFNYTRSEA